MPELENAQHELLCHEFLKDFNASRAGERVGYDAGYARALISQNQAVKDRIAELRDSLSERTAITAERIALEYARIAFHDARDLSAVLGALYHAGRTGDPADEASPTAMLEKLPRDITAPIKELTARVDARGNVTYTVKAHDKHKALDVLRERFWTPDEADDGLVTGIQSMRESGAVPDMSEDSDKPRDVPASDGPNGTQPDDTHNTQGDDPDARPTWRDNRPRRT